MIDSKTILASRTVWANFVGLAALILRPERRGVP
jgi:hypothetical protein